MATASRKYKSVTKQVPDGVSLELTKTEAIVLMHILAQVGGHPYFSPRKFVDRMWKALEDENIELVDLPMYSGRNGIYLEDHELGKDED